ncbi:MAG: glycosyltransferase family 39 protein [Patescibacteria group bacterium]
MPNLYTKSKAIVLLILILVIAIFFRFYKITEIPPGLYPDEATNGVNALDALSAGKFKVFYPENNGREGLFMNIQALSVKVFGAQPWALRIVSGVFGTLTVLGLFLLTRLLWSNKIAMLASYLMAVSFWPVNFSRIGFRAIMLPFILVWAFYFLWKGLIDKKLSWLAIAGLIYGVGFHTYISWRLSPLFLVLFFLILLFNREYKKRFVIKSGFIFLLFALIAASPLLIYYLKNPADFLGRAAQVSIFNSPAPVKALTESVIKTLSMFNIYGDGNWRHNLSGRPELFWPIGLGFLIGFITIVRHRMSYKSIFLIGWLLIMLLPNFLAPEGAPHALRALGAMPAVFIFSALGLNAIYKKIQRHFNRALLEPKNDPWFNQIKRIKKELGLLAVLLLILIGVWEGKTYFVVWGDKLEVMNNFEQRLVDIGNYLKNLPPDTKKIVVVNEYGSIIKNVSIQAQPIMFLNHADPSITYIKGEDLSALADNLENTIIIPTKTDSEIINKLTQKYPRAHLADYISFKALKIK